MDELIRKVLLGSKEAQEKCTGKGIALPCPICGRNLEKTDDGTRYVHVDPCTFMPWAIDVDDKEALAEWNNRPAPPIGACENCKHSGEFGEWSFTICKKKSKYHNFTIRRKDFCNHFQPKGEPDEN